ncbi:ABC-type amino acid transport substrate-binding protein [Roseibium hamelinense]|uniref:ABC-type amino acid transport substrate-binding protein n=1 Tax=Roseibium hamelinense TaxID=150831 RepID=A0A562TGC6_9HYPH|nr:transporter substrate-binding domain-containing protein [Roseibium hamelinense]MTI46179.1 transporter substrate-binding domain-containing protein [Roseibium hamelinense]TWI92629.1 ABC-type amino acid transport substrate-binding protein [Roseibium hamelinense]
MKASFSLVILSCFLALAVSNRVLSSPLKQPVVVTAYPDIPPLVSKDTPGQGYATLVINAAFERAGVQIELVWLPWRRGLVEMSSGRIDGSFPWFFRTERAENMHYSNAFGSEAIGLYVRADRDDLRHLSKPKDFIGETICIPVEYAVPHQLEKLIQSGEILREEADIIESCVKLLRHNRIDGMILSDASNKEEILGDVLQGVSLDRSDIFLQPETYHLMVPKTNERGTAIIKAFNKGLADLHADGSLERFARMTGLPMTALPARQPSQGN